MSGFTDALFGSDPEPATIQDVTPEVFANLRRPVAGGLSTFLNTGGPTFGQALGPTRTTSNQAGQRLQQRRQQLQSQIESLRGAQQQLPPQRTGRAADLRDGNAFAGNQRAQNQQRIAELQAELDALPSQAQNVDFGGIDPNVFTANLGENEQALLDQAFQAAQPSPFTQTARQTLQNTASGQFLDPASNPFLRDTIDLAQQSVVDRFQDVTLPRLRDQFTQAGQFVQGRPGSSEGLSSPFDEAVSRATQSAVRELGDISTRIASQNFQQERARQQQAAQAAPAFDRAQLDQLIEGLQSQALPRLIEQRGIDAGRQEFNRRLQTFLEAIRLAGNLSQPQTQSLPGAPGSPGLLGGFLSAAGGGLGGAAGGALGDVVFGGDDD